MSGEEQLQAIVDKTIENAIVNLDNYQNEVNASNDILKVKEIKEYVFGLIMGQVLLGGISALAQMKGGKDMPTPQEQTKLETWCINEYHKLEKGFLRNNGTKSKMFTYFGRKTKSSFTNIGRD